MTAEIIVLSDYRRSHRPASVIDLFAPLELAVLCQLAVLIGCIAAWRVACQSLCARF